MKNIKINDIVIVGGGSSGWLAALYLLKLSFSSVPPTITLIESDKISHIGVGESTQPGVTSFLLQAGYKQTDWMPHANATYKIGVMFDGWNPNNKFLIDSEHARFGILDSTERGFFGTHDAAIATGMTAREWSEWFPPYRMAINNKSPKFGKEALNYIDRSEHSLLNNAVQWDNLVLIEWLKSECLKLGLKYIIGEIDGVNLDEEGYIEDLKFKDSSMTISGDLYIDCSGFRSVLINDVYERPWESVEHILPTNNAVVIRKKYTNPQKECHPYTGSTAMDSGWMWTIPTYTDLSYGYVYSAKYIDKDDAEKELRTKINEWDASALHVPFRAGQRDNIAFKNVYAVGLSAGFLEPLEATNIFFSHLAITHLVQLLSETDMMYNAEEVCPHISKMFSMSVDEIVNFIYMHYRMAPKNDTQFWKEIKERPIPNQVLPMYNAVIGGPIAQDVFLDIVLKDIPHHKFAGPVSVFATGHWWQLLKGCGRYENIKKSYSDDFIKYSKLMLDCHSNKIDNVLNLFPNHYDYLTEWYENGDKT